MKIKHSIILLFLMACSVTMIQCDSPTANKNTSKEKTDADAADEEKVSFTVKDVTFSMVLVKGDTFTMGATTEQGEDAKDEEKPAHSVTLSDYYIGETEVTQALWEAVMGKDENPSENKGENLPVESVSWEDCDFFITKLNELTGREFRLPTEAEWEFAARGGNKSKGYKYSGSDTLSDVAWYNDITGGSHPVKTKAPNELGIYDMSGNVDEFCFDGYGPYTEADQTDPKGLSDAEAYVTRGGFFGSEAEDCRVSRRSSSRGYVFSSQGFRLAL